MRDGMFVTLQNSGRSRDYVESLKDKINSCSQQTLASHRRPSASSLLNIDGLCRTTSRLTLLFVSVILAFCFRYSMSVIYTLYRGVARNLIWVGINVN